MLGPKISLAGWLLSRRLIVMVMVSALHVFQLRTNTRSKTMPHIPDCPIYRKKIVPFAPQSNRNPPPITRILVLILTVMIVPPPVHMRLVNPIITDDAMPEIGGAAKVRALSAQGTGG